MKVTPPGWAGRTLWSAIIALAFLSYFFATEHRPLRPANIRHDELHADPRIPALSDADRFAFSNDGRTLAAVDPSGRILLWDVATGQNRTVLPGHFADSIKQLAFSPDATRLASLGEASIEIWDAAGGHGHSTLPVAEGAAGRQLIFSPDGSTLAVLGPTAEVAVWNTREGSMRLLPTGHSGTVNAAVFSSTGRDLASVSADGRIRIANLTPGQERSTFSGKVGGALASVIFNRDGSLVATAGGDSGLTLWNRRTGVARPLIAGIPDGSPPAMAFGADGKLLAGISGDREIGIWDTASARLNRSLVLDSSVAVTDLAFSPNGKFLASVGSDYQVRLWEISSGAFQVLTGHSAPIVKLAFVQGQQLLASVAQDGQVIVWNLQSGAQHAAFQTPVAGDPASLAGTVAPQPPVNDAAAVSPSADLAVRDTATAARAAGASATEKSARADKAERQERRKKRRSRDWKGIVSITVSPDGRYFGVAGADGNIRLLDARLRERFRSRGHGGLPASGVAFSPNGKRVISVGRDTGVNAWDNANGKRERRSFGHEHPIRTVAVSGDGKFIASGGEETRIFLWDAATGKLGKILSGHTDFVNCLAFSPDGQLLASGDADSRILLWDVATGQLIKTLLGHWDEVNTVAFSPDGRRLASGSVDSRVLLWDVASGSQLRSLNGHQGAVRTVAFSRDGASLFSAGEDSRILGWNGITGELLTQVGSLTSAANSLVVTPEGMVVIGGDDDEISEWDPKRRSKRQTATFVPEPRADSSDVDPLGKTRVHAVPNPSNGGPEAAPMASVPAVDSFWGGVIGTVLDWLVPPVHAAIPPAPGGPILVVKSASSLFSDYYAEILRTEGLNEFAVIDIGAVTEAVLAQYDVVILAKTTLDSTQVNLFSNWVNGDASHPGGNLIAIAPDPQLSGLLGLSGPGSTLSNGYLLVNTATAPGNGIVNQTMQFHGTADRYTLAGATSIATLYLDATNSTENPAVTLRAVGAHGGQAAAFTYDLATSIVQTRQGNPAWRDMERDGFPPQRSDDKFYGAAGFDSQADWIDFDKIAIPQADEQQRLLANLILHMNLSKKPLPRFWYFPRDHKAVVIMTGDDHGNNGTQGRFNQFIDASPPACSSSDPAVRAEALKNWQCVRGTSYIFPNSPLNNAQATAFEDQGFEIGLHINTGCADFTPGSLRTFYSEQLAAFATKWPGVPAPMTQRHHCIAWTDWATGAIVQLENGIRFDTSYYFWPPGWVQDRPGFFSGSGMPMRFADLDGSIIDVFHATSQMTDESGQTYPFTINTLLDRAVGASGYYGAYTINAHTDVATIDESDAVLTSAPARGVPIISSKQMLEWLDGRNGSSFGSLVWNGSALSFTVSAGNGANGLRAMLPANSSGGALVAVEDNSGSTPVPVAFTIETVKGIDYGVFPAPTGSYTATYGVDGIPPVVSGTSPVAGATGISVGSPVTATFSESIAASTLTGNFELRRGATAVPAAVSYNAGGRTATLTPSASLDASTVYTATVKGGAAGVKDLADNALAADLSWTFTTGEAPCIGAPCSAWSPSTVPGNPSVNDPGSVSLGVKFRSDLAGYISGIRFFQANPGTYTASLWTTAGELLGTATVNATTGGWQQADLSVPVPVTAGTVYVASYFAPGGRYAADNGFFATQGVTNGPISLLQDGVGGSNGVYNYGPSSAFPSASYQSSNYWIDVVFTTSVPSDGTPPEVSATLPGEGATGISVSAAVSATFSEPLNPSTVTSAAFELRNGTDTVPATVAYNATTRTVTLTPSASLSALTAYTALVKGGAGGVKDLAGNALAADVSWSFTTGEVTANPCSGPTFSLWPSNPTPSIVADSDTSSVELGVKFRPNVSGVICGIRFYKGPGNTGIHRGSLWVANTGQLLASADFQSETASGWQRVDFASPVAVTANTVYVASYLAPVGRYSADSFYFGSVGVTSGPLQALSSAEAGGNGVYVYGSGGFPSSSFQSSNYWVDVVFSTNTGPDTSPPTVVSTNPAGAAVNANPSAPVAVTFNEAIDPATIGSTTFGLQGPGDSPVPATVAYSSATNTATLTPTSPLAEQTLYTATIIGGTSGVKDTSGNRLETDYAWSFTTGVDPCSPGGNPIVCENGKAGNPPSEWDISGIGDASIQGFATDISVNRGETVAFKIQTPASDYRLDIFRMGYYGGNGARKVATIEPSASLPQTQPNCLTNATGLIDCGNWSVSASWTVPETATSGIYFAKAVREDGASAGLASHIFFIVRDDASTADLVFQTSDTTWQAYNTYGGNSLYSGSGPGRGLSGSGRAYKVSYNRPFTTREVDNGQDWVFNAEYPMVRWLEANGYNVAYIAGVDADRSGNLLMGHKVFLSVGHDEYWSAGQLANVEAARDAGVSLAFFSGNEVFWKTRWETSIDGSGTPHRTMVCYKETHEGAKIDPSPLWTGTWRDPRFSPPADGGRPENALTGTLFTVNAGATGSIVVPEADGKLRFWRNTSVASLATGTSATLPFGTLGYEWDEDIDNGFRPAGLFRLSSTTVAGAPVLQDFGSIFGSGTANHALTLYRAPGGALVFGAGTVQWAWGLDPVHDRAGTPSDPRMQQATVNLFADMNAQPGTLLPGLTPATASADSTAPTSTIASPATGAAVQPGAVVTIAGSATDTGGGQVGGVEVSTDGGATWHPAVGRGAWSYNWTVAAVSSSVNIKTRAVDDSGNLEVAGAGLTVSVMPAIASIAVTPASASIDAGATQNFAAIATLVSGGTQDVSGLVTWASSNNTIATISASGLATGVGAGATTISATLGGATGTGNLTVTTGLSVTTASLTGGKIGVSYSATLAASGGTAPYSWAFASGALPAGLTLAPSTGVISGVPVASGAASFTVQVTDAASRSATRTLGVSIAGLTAITVTPAAPSIQTDATQQFAATGTYSDGGTGTITSSVAWTSTPVDATASGQVTVSASGRATTGNGSGGPFDIGAALYGATGSTRLTVLAAPSTIADRLLFRSGVTRTAAVAGPLGLGILGNDLHAGNLPLSAISVTSPMPSGVTLDGSGAVTINRTSGTSFRYRASDGTFLSLPTTGKLVNITGDTAPTAVAETCSFTKASGQVTGAACGPATSNTFSMNLIANDTDANTTTNIPSDGVGKNVIGAVITTTGSGVGVAANPACGQSAISKTGRAAIINNCNGTVTVTVSASAPVGATSVSFTYRAVDDLGATSATRTDSISVQ